MLLFILLLVFVLSLTTVSASNVGLDDHSVKSQNDNNGYVTIQKTKSNINKHLVRTNKNKDKSDLEKDVSNRKYISLETSKKYNTNKPTRLYCYWNSFYLSGFLFFSNYGVIARYGNT